MEKKMKMIMLDDELGIYTDKYNLILVENPRESKRNPNEVRGKKHFFPNFKLMAKYIVEKKGFEYISNLSLGVSKKSPHPEVPQPIIDKLLLTFCTLDATIQGYCKELEKHLSEINIREYKNE